MKAKKRTRRTIRQAMNNEASGVPLVDNAAYLRHHFNPRSLSGSQLLTDLRSGLTIDFPPSQGKIDNLGNSLGMDLLGSGATITGDFVQIADTDDVLIVVSGQLGESYPGDDLRWRIGGGNGTDNWIRVRAQKSLPLGDTLIDTDENEINNAERPAHATDEDVFIISAIIRGTDLLHTILMDDTGEVSNITTDISAIGAFNLSSASGVTDGVAFGGVWYAGSIWTFPSGGIPDDWYPASISMADAWRNGKYTFWPYW